MIRIEGDLHTHSIACGHAMGTITENINHAKKMGHKFMASTEHYGDLGFPVHRWFFNTLIKMPDVIDDVIFLKGVEANIIDENGTIDVPEFYLEKLQIVIASIHREVLEFEGKDFTKLYCSIAENAYVDIIGHSENPAFPYNMETAVKAYAKHNKIVELNASSPSSRPGSEAYIKDLALLCKKYNVCVVVNSDAHFPQAVGNVSYITEMLEEIDFPESLVLNTNYNKLKENIMNRRNVKLP